MQSQLPYLRLSTSFNFLVKTVSENKSNAISSFPISLSVSAFGTELDSHCLDRKKPFHLTCKCSRLQAVPCELRANHAGGNFRAFTRFTIRKKNMGLLLVVFRCSEFQSATWFHLISCDAGV